uniref:hypothetical protein n=1 Tax=Herbidospora sakaeratensis TaxID=564415 RepID=UPI0007810F68|nr:hypothetical protein [Herbidospora sakaeratensis]
MTDDDFPYDEDDDDVDPADDEWDGWDDQDPGDPAHAAAFDEIRFGASLPRQGVTEGGDTVSYSTSWNEYYNDRTGEQVTPK